MKIENFGFNANNPKDDTSRHIISFQRFLTMDCDGDCDNDCIDCSIPKIPGANHIKVSPL